MGVSKVNYGEDTLIDLTADTVSEYTLYKGTTAHGANGELVTGGLISHSVVLNRNSENCSSTEFVFDCPFEPKLIIVSLLSATTSSSDANTVIDLMVWRQGAFQGTDGSLVGIEYYCGHSIGTYSGGKFEVLRHQADISDNNSVFYWDGQKTHIVSPSSTYKFSTKNYRVICVK